MNIKNADVILLKGAPGVGKSTAAKLLASYFPSGVRVEVDDLRKMVIGVKWTDQEQHRAILLLGSQLAAGFLRSGFRPVLLVDTFSGDKMHHFLSAFQTECPKRRICVNVLHATHDVLRDRLLKRVGDGFRDLSISMQINCAAVHEAKSFENLIDTSCLTPTEVAQAIMAADHILVGSDACGEISI